MYSAKLKADLDTHRPDDVPFSLEYLQLLAQQLGFVIFVNDEPGNPVQLYKETEVAVVSFYEDNRYGFAVFDSTRPLVSWSLYFEEGQFTYRPFAACGRSGGNVALWSDVDGQVLKAIDVQPEKVNLVLPAGEAIATLPVPEWVKCGEAFVCYLSEAKQMADRFTTQLAVALKRF